jgi:hypothetical protein
MKPDIHILFCMYDRDSPNLFPFRSSPTGLSLVADRVNLPINITRLRAMPNIREST